MKLSQMSTDKLCDVLCEITPYVSNIASDDNLLYVLRKAIDPKNASTKAEMLAVGIGKLTSIVQILLKARRNDIYGIVGALNDKSAQEIAKQDGITTMKQVQEIVKDKELLDFFRSCASSEGNE